MLRKLAIRNVKRSIKDYILYVFTVTLIIALMFAFNCMLFSDLIQGMNAYMSDYKVLLVLFSFIVLFVVAWLINYMTRFMLKKRSKEFGTYLILGMENKSVSKMFLFENIILGIISLIIGVAAGEFIFQFLLVIISAFFGTDYVIDTHFSFSALLLTAVYYIVIQLLVTLRNNSYLKKLKIYDLINAAKINEEIKVGHVVRNVIIFVLALAAGILSIAKVPIQLTMATTVIFIYGFYIGLSGVFVLLISKTKRFKYKGMNLFVFRQLASKINTMGFTMGTIAVLFTTAILASNYAVGLSKYKGEIDKYTPFDVCMTNLKTDYAFTDARKAMSDGDWIDQELVYRIYRSESNDFTKVLQENEVMAGYSDYDTYMKLSDYNVLRGYLGLEGVTMNDNEYIIHCPQFVAEYYDAYIKSHPTYQLNNKSYTCKKINTESFSQNGQNGSGFIIIIADRAAQNLPVYYSQYACKTKRPTTDELYITLEKLVPQDSDYWTSSDPTDEKKLDHGYGIDSAFLIYGNILVKNGGAAAELSAAIITVVVSILFIALVFICVAMTILAVQQLSDSAQYKFRYRVLDSLGVSDKKKSGVVLKQLLIYYSCPLILPFIISLIVSVKINSLLRLGTEIGGNDYSFFIYAMGVFLIVYGIYFAATYFGFKRNISTK